MTDEEEAIKAAEKRGYARGYTVGRKRKETDRYLERMRRERAAFRDRAFLAALPAAILMTGWTDGKGEKITTRDARVAFAWKIANYSTQQRDFQTDTV